MTAATHRVNAVLSEAEYAAWKATGLSLTEVIRRGLRPGASTTPPAVTVGQAPAPADVQDLIIRTAIATAAAMAARLAKVPAAPADPGPADRTPEADPPALLRALADHGHPAGSVITVEGARAAWNRAGFRGPDGKLVGPKLTRSWLVLLETANMAAHNERAEGTGQPHTWTLTSAPDPADAG